MVAVTPELPLNWNLMSLHSKQTTSVYFFFSTWVWFPVCFLLVFFVWGLCWVGFGLVGFGFCFLVFCTSLSCCAFSFIDSEAVVISLTAGNTKPLVLWWVRVPCFYCLCCLGLDDQKGKAEKTNPNLTLHPPKKPSHNTKKQSQSKTLFFCS